MSTRIGTEMELNQCVTRSEVENRDYHLNKEKALSKKLRATERDHDIRVVETGGGVRISLTTGAYEMVKACANELYANGDNEIQSCTTLVRDDQGNIVETKFKVNRGESHLYTLNMYHTTSSCLINGKETSHFMDNDLPKILENVESILRRENSSVTEMNSMYKSMLEKTFTENQTRCESGNQSALPIATNTTKSMVSDSSPEPPNIHLCDETDTVVHAVSDVPITDKYTALLECLVADVAQIRRSLDGHIKSTDQNFGQIRDEIKSVKSQLRCSNDATNRHLEDLSDSANGVKQATAGSFDAITRRLQQIADVVKNLSVKKGEPKDERGATSSIPNNQRQNDICSLQKSDTCVPKREKVLLIGDSILKGVQEPGLHVDTELHKISGATIEHIQQRISRLDSRQYKDVVIHVGGNDVSNGKDPQTTYRQLKQVTESLKAQQCNVHVCTVCPRRDVNVMPFNNGVQAICRETGANQINLHASYVNGNGDQLVNLYARDGVHLNNFGSRQLVSLINKHVKITKGSSSENRPNTQKQQVPRRGNQDNVGWNISRRPRQGLGRRRPCDVCGFSNHATTNCRWAQ